MKRTLGIAAAVLFGAMSLSGCGSSSGSAAVMDTTTLGSLSDAQAGTFCDELAAIAGGYSKEKTITCSDDGGSVMVTLSFNFGADQAGCKAQFHTALPAGCKTLTVGMVKTCITDQYNVTCATQDQNISSCDALVACATGA